MLAMGAANTQHSHGSWWLSAEGRWWGCAIAAAPLPTRRCSHLWEQSFTFSFKKNFFLLMNGEGGDFVNVLYGM